MTYECHQCRGAGEYAYPGDGLRTSKCAKCKGTGFVDFPPLVMPPAVRQDPFNPVQSYMAWDDVAIRYGAEYAIITYGRRPTGPSRIPSSRCESGKRPYCTCDLCW